MQTQLETLFALPDRKTIDDILIQHDMFSSKEEIKWMIQAMPYIYMVLNHERQIVYANQNLIEYLHLEKLTEILGSRPGEIFGCIHSTEMPGGCGTSEACEYCGFINGLLESQQTKEITVKECLMTTENDSLRSNAEFLVMIKPQKFEGEFFYFVSLNDISTEKRLHALERIFFHDVMNVAGGLRGMLQLLNMTSDPNEQKEQKEYIEDIEFASQSLIAMIQDQRELLSAERGDLVIQETPIESIAFLYHMMHQMKNHTVAQNKTIVLEKGTENIIFMSDMKLLSQVIINMLKNALEASVANDIITVGCTKSINSVTFTVHNPAFIPRSTQLQIFNRSFSTKGFNRGIGTYSMKLLTENYLKGNITFISNEDSGTTFKVEIPFKSFNPDF